MKWLLFFFGIFIVKGEAKPLVCDVSAPIAVLMDAESGKVLYEKNAQVPCYPASTTKIATALYALHQKGSSLDERVVASFDALATVSSSVRRTSGRHPSYRLEFGGTHIGLKVGEELSLKTLFYGLMLPSGNDAANVLAEAVSGTVPTFMQELNVFLKEIGCKNTFFTNPHGMPDPLHVTTASDLGLMARMAMKSSFFQEVVARRRYEKEETNSQPACWLSQTNALIRPGKHFYPYAIGIKTGYTVQAGYNLVAAAEKEGRRLIAVVCQCDELAKRYRSAVQLFETAFQEVKQTRKLLSCEHDAFLLDKDGATSVLRAVLSKDVIISFYPSEEKQYDSEVVWFSSLLPIQKGEQVGFLKLLNEDKEVEQMIPLLAQEAVYPTLSYQVKQQVCHMTAFLAKHKVFLGYILAVIPIGGACFFLARKNKGISRKKVG